jgi:hypothetical protein
MLTTPANRLGTAGVGPRPARRALKGAVLFLLLFPLLVACDDGSPECRVGADCASGVCLSDGTCQRPDAGDGDGSPDDTVEADVVEGDGAVDDGAPEDDGTGDDGALTCAPNDDGVLERSEVPVRAGLRANFAIATDVDIDTAGITEADGSRTWDFSGSLAGDHLSLEELQAPAGLWFADDFPAATYVSRLRDGEDLLGVFQATDDALQLLGVVSPEGGVFQTNLTYDPPVAVLQFPLAEGNTWTTDTTITGLSLGVASWYTETYVSRVDAHGTLATPYGTFPVLRVRVSLDRLVGMLPTSYRSFLFVAECFGTVAAAHSDAGETEVEFTRAAEVRRLAR